MGFFDFFKSRTQKDNCPQKDSDLIFKNNELKNESTQTITPFPDRNKLIEWTIAKIETSIEKGDVELVNKQYAGLIELVRQQNINTNGALDDYLNTIRDEYESFRKTYNLEYPQECLPPQERKNNTSNISDKERIESQQSNMREAKKLKKNENKAEIENIEEAVKLLKSEMSKDFPYNNHSYIWQKIASKYFKGNDMESYLYAITMSVFFGVIHYYTIIGDKEILKEFYETQSVEYVGLPNLSRFIKKMNKPDFMEKYNAVLMSFFNEIRPQVMENCKFRLEDKFSKKEMDFYNKYSLTFFEKFYNEKIKDIAFDTNL